MSAQEIYEKDSGWLWEQIKKIETDCPFKVLNGLGLFPGAAMSAAQWEFMVGCLNIDTKHFYSTDKAYAKYCLNALLNHPDSLYLAKMLRAYFEVSHGENVWEYSKKQIDRY